MSAIEVVPFLAVADAEKSVAFYVHGLGFKMKDKWEDDGVLRWCRLQLGSAGVMLQQFRTEGPEARTFVGKKGEGVVLCIFCEDSISLYRGFRERGVQASEPVVGNGLWVTSVVDPDGYKLDFESPTDAPEDTRWQA